MANVSTFVTAIVHRASDSFGVSFPDLPGCIAEGRTQQDAWPMQQTPLPFTSRG